ncbi:HAMP domain-containing histidine kinase [Waterburya agarophytonicola K14]|uniref:histidine kinase n=1 Tax=Waterburya agarophytonicola KI4 TaxID=2874699 RepID=A0A964FGL3_9CYAN|nr:HAMP domain-containing sensor histidine kinase [Waterburya agarophytonicola]MCC0176759.1 HAMP domain-containing histidine kinase [Waterburya agarophytonicola KI4]
MLLYSLFKQLTSPQKKTQNIAVERENNYFRDSSFKAKLVGKILDTASLKVRLTVGIAGVAALGMGGLAVWTSMRMQHILVSTNKENMKYIATRFPQDVKIYSEMIPLEEGAKRAIASLSTTDKLIWIKDAEGNITAKSQTLNTPEIGDTLLAVQNVPLIPQVQDLHGSYWLMCATPLQVNGINLGQLYLAHNITRDQVMFLNLMRSLAAATIIAIATMTAIIAFYIDRSMQPLKKISQLTATISADKLDQARISLEQAPSEVKELAETVDGMLIRLSDSWGHQRELLSNVSHELRTPLTIISGYIQSILRRSDNLSEMQTEALKTAASEADRTVQLLQDLLDLARLDSDRMQFQLEPIILNDLLHEVVGMAKQYSARIITLDLKPDIIAIKADSHRLKQVLLNLIDNAVKYSEPATPITLKLNRENDRAIIQLCDRGVGIPLQQQGRIFERFFRVDESRNRAGGTGLGLSIVKTLVEGMAGNITVRSQLNEGSTFTLSFPAQ